MRYRIAVWAGAGFLVAGFWGLLAFVTFRSGEGMRDVWRDLTAIINLTCPIAIAGMHYPISVYEALVANAITYAMVGFLVEMARQQLHPAK